MNKTEAALFGGGDWWNREGAFRLLHDINPHRLRWLTDAAGELSGRRLLDFGCGGGIFAEAAAAAGAVVTGVDESPGALTAATDHAAAAGLEIRYLRPAELNAAERYDIVTCFEVLEHTDNPAALVADIAALLKPGGIAVFSTINRTFRAWRRMIVGVEIMLKLLPPGAHDYRRFIKPAELATMCRRSGLSVTAVTGLVYSLFGHVYLLDERDTGVNYFLAARRRD